MGVVSRRRSSAGEEHVGVLEKKKSYRRRSDPIRYLIWKWRVGRQEQGKEEQGKPSLRSVLEAKLFLFFSRKQYTFFFFLIGGYNIHKHENTKLSFFIQIYNIRASDHTLTRIFRNFSTPSVSLCLSSILF